MRGMRHGLARAKRYLYKRRVLASLAVERRDCPVCGGRPEPTNLINRDRYGLPQTLDRCSVCGLIYQNPFPTAAFLEHFYKDGLYHGLYLRSQEPEGEEGDVADAKHAGNLASLHALGFGPGRSLLDFGTGNGGLVRAAREAYPDARVTGVEPNATYFSESVEGSTFDFILAMHVFEHLHDPVPVLRQLAAQLTPAGRVLIEVPDLSRYPVGSMKAFHLAHVLHFNRTSLERLLAEAGLTAVSWEPPINPYGLRVIARAR